VTAPALTFWTVYLRPSDFPNHVAVRAQSAVLDGRGLVQPGAVACLYDTMAEAMFDCECRGLTFVPRAPGDDPPIVGSWI
jgi:hypothetical protein